MVENTINLERKPKLINHFNKATTSLKGKIVQLTFADRQRSVPSVLFSYLRPDTL